MHVEVFIGVGVAWSTNWESTNRESTNRGTTMKTALMEKTGLMQDPLTAGKLFMAHCQHTDEKVADCAVSLKKLFKQAYPDEALLSGILLQRFVIGLLPTISQQVLLQGKPKSLDVAVESA